MRGTGGNFLSNHRLECAEPVVNFRFPSIHPKNGSIPPCMFYISNTQYGTMSQET